MVKASKKKEPILVGKYNCTDCRKVNDVYEKQLYLDSYFIGPTWNSCFLGFVCLNCKSPCLIDAEDYSGDPMKLPKRKIKSPPKRCTIM